MRIVDRTTFLAMPEGTIYSQAVPGFLDGLYVKGETLNSGRDWYALSLLWIDDRGHDDIAAFFDDRQPFPINEAECRDGMFDQGQLFAIYEPCDLQALRAHVDRALELSANTRDAG